MELAVNMFTGGMVLDSHPLVQSSNTLSDALNATYITMNGNEVILQNDMGNRRVDNAYLPAGYEPVGIKEHGGIIYIAAYNPITHRSLIGSFPSPERKIDINDTSLQKSFDFDIFSKNENSEEDSSLNNLLVLKNDSYLIPLTKDNSLHVGDKYIVYCKDKLSSMLSEISHYNNIKEGKVKSPKNRKYTIELGILDNQNSFHDLSEYLMRWEKNDNDEDVIIKNLEEKSDLYKNNVGYFIPDDFVSNIDIEGNTIDDTNLITSRKQIAANTFSYKLAGPLYMRISYNHIQNFSCDIRGEILENNKIKLILTGYLTYNCPDDLDNVFVTNGGDEDYYSYNLLPKYDGIDFRLNLDYELFKVESGKLLKINTTEDIIIDYTQSVYNKIDNVYNIVLTKTYIFEKPENNIFEYVIGVNSGISNEDSKDIYIRGLSYKGSLDLNLLNSGELSLSQYRFYNNSKTRDTNMVLVFNSYPKEDETLENIRLLFTNITNTNDNNHYLYTRQKIINGQLVLSFNWNASIVKKSTNPDNLEELLSNPLQDRTTYKVTIYYDVVNTKTSESSEVQYIEKNNIEARWYLTTELFNDVYNSLLIDFCNSIYTDDNKLFLRKLTIAPDEKNTRVLYDVNYDNVTYQDPNDPNKNNNFEPLYRVSQKTVDSLTLFLKVTMVRIKDEDAQKLDNSLYPKYVGELFVNVDGRDTITIVNSETIQKQLYELLDSVYLPLRTVLQQKDKVDLVVLFYTEADIDDDWNKCKVSYKKTHDWPSLFEEEHSMHGYIDGYVSILYVDGENAPADLTINTFEDLGGIPDISKYKKLLAKGFCLADGDDDIEDTYSIGSCYLVKDTWNNLVFVKNRIIDLDIELLNLLINWEEESISSPSLFKIKGKVPELKTKNEKTLCTINLTTTTPSNVTIGNLIFNLDVSQKTLNISIPYHNQFIIDAYVNYLSNPIDSYVDMNTGKKMLSSDIVLKTSNGLFEVLGCKELIYCGNYTDITSGYIYQNYEDYKKGVAYSFADLSDPMDCAIIRGRKKV